MRRHRGKSVLKHSHKSPRRAPHGDKKQFSYSADMSQKINSDSGPKSLMRGGIRL